MAKASLRSADLQVIESVKVLEAFLSKLCSRVAGRELVALSELSEGRFESRRPWMFYKWERSESALSLEGLRKPGNPLARLSDLLDIAALMEEGELLALAGQMPQIIPGFSHCSPLYERQFALYDVKNQSNNLIAYLHYAETSESLKGSLASASDESRLRLVKKKQKVFSRRFVLSINLMQENEEDLLNRRSKNIRTYQAKLSNNEASHGIKFAGSNGSLNCVVEENSMNEIKKHEMVKLSLSLGEIELSEEDYLNLRVGSKIEINNTDSFTGVLQVEGEAIARAKVTIEDSGLKVEVLEFGK